MSTLHGRRIDIPPLEKLKIMDSKVYFGKGSVRSNTVMTIIGCFVDQNKNLQGNPVRHRCFWNSANVGWTKKCDKYTSLLHVANKTAWKHVHSCCSFFIRRIRCWNHQDENVVINCHLSPLQGKGTTQHICFQTGTQMTFLVNNKSEYHSEDLGFFHVFSNCSFCFLSYYISQKEHNTCQEAFQHFPTLVIQVLCFREGRSFRKPCSPEATVSYFLAIPQSWNFT